MQMLYDSDSFVVVHMLPDAVEQKGGPLNDTAPPAPQLARHGFEIVDKRSGKEVYLDGSWAEMFQQQILAWQRDTPTQEEVEDALDRYAGLAQNPVVVPCAGVIEKKGHRPFFSARCRAPCVAAQAVGG